MRAGSLCTGIGGLDLAVHAVYGAETIWCAEYEPCLDPIIQHRFGPVLNLKDITTVDWTELEPVDVLTAGYPCQPFSHAGKRKGASDVRHLWPHIAEAVRVLRPGRVVLENVAGHLSLGFGDVLRDLAEAGFDAEWCVLRASDVGAPHQRARLFIVASDADQAGPQGTQPTGRRHLPTGSGGLAADASDLGHERGGPSREWGDGPPNDGDAAPYPGGERHGGGEDTGGVGRVDVGDAGEARERERSRPVTGDRSREAPADTEESGQPGRSQGADATTLVRPAVGASTRADAGQAPAGVRELGRGAGVAWGQYEPAIRRWEHTLGRPAPRPTDDAGRLSPAFVEWMQGYPEGWTAELTRTQALKALGNAVVPQQGEAAIRLLEAAHALGVAA